MFCFHSGCTDFFVVPHRFLILLFCMHQMSFPVRVSLENSSSSLNIDSTFYININPKYFKNIRKRLNVRPGTPVSLHLMYIVLM